MRSKVLNTFCFKYIPYLKKYIRYTQYLDIPKIKAALNWVLNGM